MRKYRPSACAVHGLDRHIYIHESGHAVAAIDNGVPFKQIVIYADEDRPAYDSGAAQAPAAVEMLSEDASTWVAPDRLAALRFVLAGTLTELELLGDAIDGGYTEDLDQWRRGSGQTGSLTIEDLDESAGGSWMALGEELRAWARTNQAAIERLADHLATLPHPSEMPYDDVITLLGS